MARDRHQTNRPKRGRGGERSGSSADQWLCGLHSVREALRARRRRIDRLLLRVGTPRAEYRELVGLAAEAGVPIEEVEAEVLERLAEADGNHQGVALRAGPMPEDSLSGLMDRVDGASAGSRVLVALDGVEDPQNVGALARVAESAGARGMILTRRRAPPLTSSVARASAGAIEWLPVARVPNLARALADLKARGYWIVAAAPEARGNLFAFPDRLLTGKLVVVLGAEGTGLRKSILDGADYRVEIPMRGQVQSLNVATAGAVILYDLLRRAEADPAAPGG